MTEIENIIADETITSCPVTIRRPTFISDESRDTAHRVTLVGHHMGKRAIRRNRHKYRSLGTLFKPRGNTASTP